MIKLPRFLVAAVIPFALAGCMRGTTLADEQLASDGAEESAASAQSTNIGNVVFTAITSQDPNTAASDVGTSPQTLLPEGCVSRSKDASDPLVAHITFNDCTGPFGLVHLKGEVVATFSAGTGGALHVDLAGKSLTANDHPLDYAATADVTLDGAMRDVKWHGSWKATTTKGLAVDHSSDLTISVDTAALCLSGSGTAETSVATRGVNTDIKDYKICLDGSGAVLCPTGSVTHTVKLTGKQISVAFDGSDKAEITGANGRTFDVALICKAAATE